MSQDPWDEFEAEIDAENVDSESEDERAPATGFTSRIISWGGAGPSTVVSSVSKEEHDKRLLEFQATRKQAHDATIDKKLKTAGSLIMSNEAKKSDRCIMHAEAGRAPHGAEVVALRSVGEVFDIAFAPPAVNERRERHSNWCVTAEGSPNILCLWTWSFTNNATCGKCQADTVPGATKCRRCKMTVSTHAVLQSTRLHRRFYGHFQPVHCVAVSPNAKYIVSGSMDNDVRVWRVGSLKAESTPEKQLKSRGQCIRVIRGHTRPVTCVRFNNDGTMLITTSRDGTARIWDTTPLATQVGSRDATDGEESSTEYVRPKDAEAFSQLYLLTGFISDVTSADIASDSTYVVVSGYDPYVRLYPMFNDSRINAAAYKCQAQMRAHSDWVLACCFWHPASKQMVLPDDALEGRNERYGEVDEHGNTQEFVEWVEEETGVFGKPEPGSSDESLSSHTDDDELASSDDDNGSAGEGKTAAHGETRREKRRRLKLVQQKRQSRIEAAEAKRRARIKTVRQWQFMCASAGADYSIKLWNVFTQKLIRRMKCGRLTAMELEAQRLKSLDAATSNADNPPDTLSKAVRQASQKYAGSSAVAAGVSGGVGEESKTMAADVKPRSFYSDGHVDQITAVDFSPDGSLLVSSGGDGKVILWSVETGERLETLTALAGKNAINKCCFSPDGHLIAGGEYGRLRLWRNAGTADDWKARQKLRRARRERSALPSR